MAALAIRSQVSAIATSVESPIVRYASLLREHFGYPDFRDGQERVLSELARGDVLAVMPTGSGKSMCYVLPALAEGRVLVVSPLIALMQDQVESLAAAGVPAGFINSSLDRAAQNRAYVDFLEGRLKLLYVAPERFTNARFVDGLRGAGVRLLAIDEAHCMSEWGHDFRPDYLTLGSVRERLGSPLTLALTATADPGVQRDIAAHLGIEDGRRVVTSVARPNLKLSVVDPGGPRNAAEWLRRYVKARSDQAGIVYARTRKLVEETAEMLQDAGIAVAAYHAGMTADVRRDTQRRFTLDQVHVIVATNAFGLGVDKADIRFVVHLNMPGRVESYYQEAGRAGRDGDPAECTLLFDRRDEGSRQFFIDKAHPSAEGARQMWHELVAWSESNDGAPLRRDESVAGQDGYAIVTTALRHSGLIDQAGRLTSHNPDAPIDVESILAHRRYAEERLGRMVDYAESGRCRHALILSYFGERPEDRCEACDNCLGEGGSAVIDPIATLCEELMDLRERLGTQYRRELSEIMDPRTVRELAAYRPHDGEELLETWGVGPVKARWFGEEVLRVIHDWEEAHPGATLRPERVARRKPVLSDRPLAEVDQGLYARLAEWRLGRAKRDGVPAYVVFSNRTLREIAALRPAGPEALSQVWGVGHSRADHYGDEVLAVLNAAG